MGGLNTTGAAPVGLGTHGEGWAVDRGAVQLVNRRRLMSLDVMLLSFAQTVTGPRMRTST